MKARPFRCDGRRFCRVDCGGGGCQRGLRRVLARFAALRGDVAVYRRAELTFGKLPREAFSFGTDTRQAGMPVLLLPDCRSRCVLVCSEHDAAFKAVPRRPPLPQELLQVHP